MISPNATNFGGVPFVQHNALSRTDLEASLDIRPPAIERDFALELVGEYSVRGFSDPIELFAYEG